jgi:5'-nucleotidase
VTLRSPRRTLVASVAALSVLLVAAPFGANAVPKTDKPPPQAPANGVRDTQVQILAINDFHGNLEDGPGLMTNGAPSGGAEYLATHIRDLKAQNPNSVVVSAGDLIGASPLLSALFHDEPTIETMNAIGLDINAVGNHEFDDGYQELLRMKSGGCHPVDGCIDGTPFGGAEFDFLAANVRYAGTTETVFPSYTIESFPGGAKVAFIGMTLENTPSVVTPEGVAGLEFDDEADTVNALIGELRGMNVRNIVVLVHEGGSASGGINGCTNVSGPIVDIVQRLDPEVDAVISGHTHAAYNCVIDGRPVTSASSFGRVLTKMDLTIDAKSRDIKAISVNNRAVTRTVPKATDITAILDHYRPFYAPLANRVIGRLLGDSTILPRAAAANGESLVGRLIADSQQARMAPDSAGSSQLALMNPGGIRADLIAKLDGSITYEAAFLVQPFGNTLTTMTLTGTQLDQVLEQQFCGPNSGLGRKVLQVSAGFSYTWDFTKVNAPCATADAVAFDSITIGGQPLVAGGAYRVTVNSFLASGGDNFPTLALGTARSFGPLDLVALEAFLQESPDGYVPVTTPRITRLN